MDKIIQQLQQENQTLKSKVEELELINLTLISCFKNIGDEQFFPKGSKMSLGEMRKAADKIAEKRGLNPKVMDDNLKAMAIENFDLNQELTVAKQKHTQAMKDWSADAIKKTEVIVKLESQLDEAVATLASILIPRNGVTPEQRINIQKEAMAFLAKVKKEGSRESV